MSPDTPSSTNMTYWAVVPAAGSGARMGAALPKQYLSLAGKTILELTLNRLLTHSRISGVVVAVAEDDRQWSQLALGQHPKIMMVNGGRERCHSVLNGLLHLKQYAQPQDWVLVHDAARPCLRTVDIDRLIEALSHHPVGGILALPVADTVKRADAEGNIRETVDRQGLWRALTPQMFRVHDLIAAMQAALTADDMVTDEAAAMERIGKVPRVIEGHGDNIKITRPQDLALAELYLKQQEAEA